MDRSPHPPGSRAREGPPPALGELIQPPGILHPAQSRGEEQLLPRNVGAELPFQMGFRHCPAPTGILGTSQVGQTLGATPHCKFHSGGKGPLWQGQGSAGEVLGI